MSTVKMPGTSVEGSTEAAELCNPDPKRNVKSRVLDITYKNRILISSFIGNRQTISHSGWPALQPVSSLPGITENHVSNKSQ